MDDKSREVNEELLDSFAKDALQLFRINLIIFTIVLSAIALLNEQVSEAYFSQFFNSIYTLTAGLLWMGSMVASILSYRGSRRLLLKERYQNEGAISDENLQLNTVSAVATSSLLAVLSLVFGVLDGLGESGIEVYQPIGIILLSLVFVAFSFNFYSIVDMARDYAPSIIWDVWYVRWGAIYDRFSKSD